MPKLIREGRFGPPKTLKTGSVCGTYPKPMLVFEYEADGLSILDQKVYDWFNKVEYKAISKKVLIDVLSGKPDVKLPSQQVNYLDLVFKGDKMTADYSPAKDKNTFADTVDYINLLLDAKVMPFKTIVIDTVSGLSESILSHQAVVNSAALADARKWAGNVGAKTMQVINFFSSAIPDTEPPQYRIPAHVVFIFHTDVEKDEDTKKMGEFPLMYSKSRQSVHKAFSQFFYQENESGKPQLWTVPYEYRKGIGCRWPSFKGSLVGPTFNEIYGGEPDVLR